VVAGEEEVVQTLVEVGEVVVQTGDYQGKEVAQNRFPVSFSVLVRPRDDWPLQVSLM